MPPKKKGKKGKKGKKDKDSAGSAEGERPTSGKELTELSKEFFLIQIKDLEQRLNRYQQKCDDLEVSNLEFKDKHDQQIKDKKEIVSFLKKQLEQKQDELADCNDRLIGLQQAKDAEKETYEKQLLDLKHEFQETKDQLTSENMILGGKLSSLEEFKVQKEGLMKKFQEQEETIKQREEDHKNTIYKLERKAVVDKDRLKKEMVLRVNTVAAEFRKVSNKQMADTTKRTIRENVSINSQLTKMSEKTKELVEENDTLTAKDKDNKREIELLEAAQEELAKKNNSNLKVLKMLTEKAKSQEVMLEEMEAREQEYEQCFEELEEIRSDNERMTMEVNGLENKCESLEHEIRDLNEQNNEMNAAKERLEDVLAAATMSLTQVLSSETSSEDEIDKITHRQRMIERLLLVLNSAAVMGKGPPPAELFQQRPKVVMAPFMPKSKTQAAKKIVKEPSNMSTFPHYKLGDLGLIPRPLPNQKNIGAAKLTQLSQTTRIGLKFDGKLQPITPQRAQPGVDMLTQTNLASLSKLPPLNQIEQNSA